METMNRREWLAGMGAAAMLPLALGLQAEAQQTAGVERVATLPVPDADGGIGPETVYELRVYHLNEGKQPLILERFRTRERAIFARCGMHPIAYWTALDGPAIEQPGGHTLIYIVRHRSRTAADASWAKFRTDPEWVAVKAESEKDGAFVWKQEHTFMKLTEFSPQL